MYLSTNQLKWLALATMVLDHLAFFFPTIFPFWFHYVGRTAAPVFLWLIVINSERSRNPLKMVSTLLLWGIGMMAGNAILTIIATLFLGETATPLYGFGIFLSLAVTVGVTIVWRTLTDRESTPTARIVAVLSLPFLIFTGLATEGSYAILSLAILFTVARTSPVLLSIGMASISAFLLMEGAQFGISPLDYYQWMCIAALPFILLHRTTNDRRPSTRARLWFYLFYPLHIWVFYILSLLIQR
jgi:hypothetical protein